jgi:hypothetical protein
VSIVRTDTCKVPSAEAAKSAAVGALIRAGLGAQEALAVGALLRIAKADEKLGRAGDFVWEVRVTWGFDVTGLVWVGASTGEARILYRP